VANSTCDQPVQRRIWSLPRQFNIITNPEQPIHGAAYFTVRTAKLNALDTLQKGAIQAGIYPANPDTILQDGWKPQAFPSSGSGFLLWRYEYQTRGRANTALHTQSDLGGLATLNSLPANASVRQILAQIPPSSTASRSATCEWNCDSHRKSSVLAPDFFNEHDFQQTSTAVFTNTRSRPLPLRSQARTDPNAGLAGPRIHGCIRQRPQKADLTDVDDEPRTVGDFRISYSRDIKDYGVPTRSANFPNVASMTSA